MNPVPPVHGFTALRFPLKPVGLEPLQTRAHAMKRRRQLRISPLVPYSRNSRCTHVVP
jgi:hypothetical protein